jgi:hypothetical protein
MSLAAQALTGIALPPGLVGITCHQAVWYWAALEAEAQGLVAAKPFITRMGNIMAIPGGGPQNAMLAMPTSGNLDFATNGGALPPVGTVLLWTASPTHSAVVTANGICGYNQACVLPVPNLGTYSTGQPNQLVANKRQVLLISEADIVKTAGGVFHL